MLNLIHEIFLLIPTLLPYITILIIINYIIAYSIESIICKKGYNDGRTWFWCGFFFGLPVLLIALLKPDLNTIDKILNEFEKYLSNKK